MNNETDIMDVLQEAQLGKADNVDDVINETTETIKTLETVKPTDRFRAVINPKLFYNWLNNVSILVDEAKLTIEKNGLTIKAVNPAHVAMISTTLPKKAFEEFRLSAPIMNVGINILKICECIKEAEKGDVLEIDILNVSDTPTIKLTFGMSERIVSGVDINGLSDPKVPNLNLPTHITLAHDRLLKIVKLAGQVSDHIELENAPEGFKITATGDLDKVNMTLNKDMAETEGEPARSLFPLDYLTNMVKALTGNYKHEKVKLDMGNDYPVRISAGNDSSETVYLLAPRIEE